MESRDFYLAIPEFQDFSEVTKSAHYRRVPDDWVVVLTDVQGSTRAIADNKYKEVNLLGASSIVAILNAVNRKVPFVFGGDGATVLIHESDIERVRPVLLATEATALKSFGLKIRSALIPVRDLTAVGASIEVARYRLSSAATLAMMRGGGLSQAEKWMKQEGRTLQESHAPVEADFSGLSCRWNPVPAKRGEIISLMIMALGTSKEIEETYSQVLAGVETIIGGGDSHPITVPKLDAGFRPANLKPEIVLKGAHPNWWYSPMIALRIMTEYLFIQITHRLGIKFRFFDTKKYIESLTASSDFRKFDDTLRMVRDCRSSDRQKLQSFLEEWRLRGKIAYGLHVSKSAMMTCIMYNIDDHVHFIDGADGGYALAASQLKDQLSRGS